MRVIALLVCVACCGVVNACRATGPEVLPRASIAIVAPAHLVADGLDIVLMDALANGSIAPRDGSVSISMTTFDERFSSRVLLRPTVLRDDTLTDVLGGLRVTLDTDVESDGVSCALADAMLTASSLDADITPGGVRHILVIAESLPSDDPAAAAALRTARDDAIQIHGVDLIHCLVFHSEQLPSRQFIAEHIAGASQRFQFPVGWSMSVPATERNTAMVAVVPVAELVAARADLLATSQYDHIHGMFLDDREYPRDFVAASDSNFPDTWSTTGVLPVERHLGMAMGYGHLNVTDSLVRMLQRIFHRPGDYDRDGAVEVTFTAQCNGSYSGTPSGDDWTKFLAGVSAFDPYADWNFDGTHNGQEGPPNQPNQNEFGVDFSKFITDVLGGCP